MCNPRVEFACCVESVSREVSEVCKVCVLALLRRPLNLLNNQEIRHLAAGLRRAREVEGRLPARVERPVKSDIVNQKRAELNVC